MNAKSAIDMLMDGVKWEPVEYETEPSLVSDVIPHATHRGVLRIYNTEFRVYQLSNGQRIIDAEDLEEFFQR